MPQKIYVAQPGAAREVPDKLDHSGWLSLQAAADRLGITQSRLFVRLTKQQDLPVRFFRHAIQSGGRPFIFCNREDIEKLAATRQSGTWYDARRRVFPEVRA